ncbi:hypothetical protein FZC79_10350 [Rossellomorea vietnamensis]|uniref:Uncharacterized protein n=1 Tax=Rossellomorea vietnamensis TaxID=218284 RepID=A0A5D4KEF3_9BACI|nr:hypothetical protein [Rossellomorea vietnamensis]TYR75562.1 hypothetical protein FZC79_10350 [Rossellomorea vietnamensis]
MNLKTIKAEMNSGRMSLEAMEWLVKRVERYEEALIWVKDCSVDYQSINKARDVLKEYREKRGE